MRYQQGISGFDKPDPHELFSINLQSALFCGISRISQVTDSNAIVEFILEISRLILMKVLLTAMETVKLQANNLGIIHLSDS